ncbi:DNA-binding response regulator, OmpR family, contains REC and winged-helix (wHTH) domain [Variovorax sp. 770b2]|nr:DNA-binding response regulator, OmpR family, contains REC and winged-helix (wHTH) domain [Variovorax sp. 770b2]
MEVHQSEVRDLLRASKTFLQPAELPKAYGMRIAVLDDSDPNRDFVCSAVRALGHGAAEFRRIEHLAQLLDAGEKFDIVVAALSGDRHTALSNARYLRHIAGMSMPVLLMLHPEQLRSAETFVMDPAIDFILMPCEECEIVARILATTINAAHFHRASTRLVFGHYLFEPRFSRVSFHGEKIRLKPREFDLALFLFQNAGVAQPRDVLFKAVWPEGTWKAGVRTIDVHVSCIRRKLKLNFGDHRGARLSTLHGIGYLLTFFERQEDAVT